MPRAAPKKPELTEEQLERIRSVSREDGGGLMYVTIKKLNEKGQEYHFGTRCYLTLEQVENDRQTISADLGGGGDYLWRIYSTDQAKRTTPVDMFKVTVTGMPALSTEEVEKRMTAKEVQVGTQGTAAWLHSLNGGTPQAPPNPSSNMPWYAQYFQPMQQQQKQEKSAEELAETRQLRRQLDEMREQARAAEHKREIESMQASHRSEITSLNTKFERMMEKLEQQASQPKTDTIAESVKALGPLAIQYLGSQQAARDKQMDMLMAVMQKSPLQEMTPLLEQQAKAAEAARQEAQNLQKVLFESLNRDSTEGTVKMFGAMAQQQQAFSGMISALLAQLAELSAGERESPWVEGLRDLVASTTSAVNSLVSGGEGPPVPPQLAAPSPQRPPEPSPQRPPEPSVDARVEHVRQQVLALVDNGEDAIRVAAGVIQYAEYVQRHKPSDPDVAAFWDDHEAGTRRILGGHLAQMGGQGQKYLQEVLEALPRAFEALAEERAGLGEESDE